MLLSSLRNLMLPLALIVTAAPALATTLTQSSFFFTQQTFGLDFEVENFSGVPPTLLGQTSYDLGDFTVSSAAPFDVASNVFCPTTGIGLGKCISSVLTSVTVTFDNPIKALSFTLADTTLPPQFFFRIDGTTLLTANSFPAETPPLTELFIGIFDATTPFSTVKIISAEVPTVQNFTTPNIFYVDNLRYGADPVIVDPVNPVPLPASSALLIAGLGLMSLARMRRRPACDIPSR